MLTREEGKDQKHRFTMWDLRWNKKDQRESEGKGTCYSFCVAWFPFSRAKPANLRTGINVLCSLSLLACTCALHSYSVAFR